MLSTCILTNDVELTSIYHGGMRNATGKRVLEAAMPSLLEMYKRYGIKTTFFITGDIASIYPDVVRIAADQGHEIGSHGWSHRLEDSFDLHPFDWQVNELKRSKSLLEDLSGQEVISFRAPALRTNRHTPRALVEAGFHIDSSVSPQRFDFFFSTGNEEKMKWLRAERRPYFVSDNNLSKPGNLDLLEIPVSALIMPYIGTTMRMFPLLSRLLRSMLLTESRYYGTVLTFLFHPNEIVDESGEAKDELYGANKSLISGRLRRWLKLRNLGPAGLRLHEQHIKAIIRAGCGFTTAREYYQHYRGNHRDSA
ncbi:MAG TPA: polysaccharide deacetylase family protein [Bacteroidota bacterium]|nr:polysaccharide deacetylase family protein [Bacteroidota bacterium]